MFVRHQCWIQVYITKLWVACAIPIYGSMLLKFSVGESTTRRTLCPRRTPHIISRLAETGTQQPTYIISRSCVHMLLLIGVLCSERKAVSESKVSFRHVWTFASDNSTRLFHNINEQFGNNLSLCFSTSLSTANVVEYILVTSKVNQNKLSLEGRPVGAQDAPCPVYPKRTGCVLGTQVWNIGN